jgi:hypothetical protein
VVAVVLATATAHAQPVAHALPGEESGRVDVPDDQDSAGRAVARGALWAPRYLLIGVLAPVQGTVWAFDRYQLQERYYDTFYTEDRTFGIVPTAGYQTGLGFVAGGELIWKDAFGRGEQVNLRGMWGGTYRLRSGGAIDTGDRLGPMQLRASGTFDRLPDDPFFGIGNSDRGPRPPPGTLLDPRATTVAVKTYNRYQIANANLSAIVDLVDHLSAIATGSYIQLRYDPSHKSPSIQTVWVPSELTGFQDGVDQVYGEGELRWDTRRPASPWEPPSLHAVGTYVDGFGGYVHGLRGASSYWRYGVDLQQYIRVGRGPRVLELRLYGEGVTGSLDQVPFSELPHLGGDFLRGYVYDRFRDRISVLATAQYYWDISNYAAFSLFVDGGRVYSSLDDLSLDNFRVGLGPGLEVHGDQFMFESYLGFSIDGDVTFSVQFRPISDRRAHWW